MTYIYIISITAYYVLSLFHGECKSFSAFFRFLRARFKPQLEAAVRRFSSNQVLLKGNSNTGIRIMNIAKFLRTPFFYRTPPVLRTLCEFLLRNLHQIEVKLCQQYFCFQIICYRLTNQIYSHYFLTQECFSTPAHWRSEEESRPPPLHALFLNLSTDSRPPLSPAPGVLLKFAPPLFINFLTYNVACLSSITIIVIIIDLFYIGNHINIFYKTFILQQQY